MARGQWRETSPSMGERAGRSLRIVQRRAALAGMMASAFPLMAHAQVFPQQAISNPVPQGSPIPRILPPAPPAVSPQGIELPSAGPTTPVSGPPVPITQVSVDGVTVYPASELAALTAGLTGPAVPFDRIDAARQAILRHYRADGYGQGTQRHHPRGAAPLNSAPKRSEFPVGPDESGR